MLFCHYLASNKQNSRKKRERKNHVLHRRALFIAWKFLESFEEKKTRITHLDALALSACVLHVSFEHVDQFRLLLDRRRRSESLHRKLVLFRFELGLQLSFLVTQGVIAIFRSVQFALQVQILTPQVLH